MYSLALLVQASFLNINGGVRSHISYKGTNTEVHLDLSASDFFSSCWKVHILREFSQSDIIPFLLPMSLGYLFLSTGLSDPAFHLQGFLILCHGYKPLKYCNGSWRCLVFYCGFFLPFSFLFVRVFCLFLVFCCCSFLTSFSSTIFLGPYLLYQCSFWISRYRAYVCCFPLQSLHFY